MSLHALSSGTLATDPIKRTGTKGKPYVTANLRVTAEDSSLLVSVICFDAEVCKACGAVSGPSGFWRCAAMPDTLGALLLVAAFLAGPVAALALIPMQL